MWREREGVIRKMEREAERTIIGKRDRRRGRERRISKCRC